MMNIGSRPRPLEAQYWSRSRSSQTAVGCIQHTDIFYLSLTGCFWCRSIQHRWQMESTSMYFTTFYILKIIRTQNRLQLKGHSGLTNTNFPSSLMMMSHGFKYKRRKRWKVVFFIWNDNDEQQCSLWERKTRCSFCTLLDSYMRTIMRIMSICQCELIRTALTRRHQTDSCRE